MSRQISNEQEFQDNLKKLGELYEKGKDLTTALLPVGATPGAMEGISRLTWHTSGNDRLSGHSDAT